MEFFMGNEDNRMFVPSGFVSGENTLLESATLVNPKGKKGLVKRLDKEYETVDVLSTSGEYCLELVKRPKAGRAYFCYYRAYMRDSYLQDRSFYVICLGPVNSRLGGFNEKYRVVFWGKKFDDFVPQEGTLKHRNWFEIMHIPKKLNLNNNLLVPEKEHLSSCEADFWLCRFYREYEREHKLPKTSEEQIDYHGLSRKQVDRRMREYRVAWEHDKAEKFKAAWEEQNKDLINRDIKK